MQKSCQGNLQAGIKVSQSEVASLCETSQVIQQWIIDLSKKTTYSGDSFDWDSLGRGILVQSEDELLALSVIQHVCDASGWRLHVCQGLSDAGDFQTILDSLDSTHPTLIYVSMENCAKGSGEEGRSCEKLSASGTAEYSIESELVSAFANSLDATLAIVVVRVNQFSQVRDELRAGGLLARRICLPVPSSDLMAEEFVKRLGYDLFDSTVLESRDRLGSLLKNRYEDRRIRGLFAMALKRRHSQTGTRISMNDLLEFSAYGTVERDPIKVDGEELWRTAIHEAGHAASVILYSKGQYFPVFCSVKKTADSLGVTVTGESLFESDADDLVLSDFLKKIRVRLAGRAAEALFLGAQSVSVHGSNSDLETATELATFLLTKCGLHWKTDDLKFVNSNLSIIEFGDSDKEKLSKVGEIESLLADQMFEVSEVLKANSKLVLSIAHALRSKLCLFEKDFINICNELAI
jgi:hypothetical protein